MKKFNIVTKIKTELAKGFRGEPLAPSFLMIAGQLRVEASVVETIAEKMRKDIAVNLANIELKRLRREGKTNGFNGKIYHAIAIQNDIIQKNS